jgi:signal transduction histidine kinase
MLNHEGGSDAGRERDGNARPPLGAVGRPSAQEASTSTVVLDHLQPVLDRLPEAILVTDADGLIRLTNSAADRLFADDPVQDGADLLGRFDGTAAIGHRPVAGEQPRRVTVRPRHQPNTWFALDHVPFEGVPDPERGADDRVGSVWVLRDVTDSADLHAEREAFLAVLSHELRTPLTTIYAGSSVLARRDQLDPPATRTLAMDISAEAARLYDLVENLLVIARLERRILEPLDEPVDLGQALDFAIRTTTDRVPEANIVREGVRRPPPVRGDTTYVEQACRNLLLAGLRAGSSDAGKSLVVRVDLDANAREVAVRVFDRGPALSEEELGQAFDLPPDAGTGSRLEGTGMGPFVVRHVIDAMHGRTWAVNREGGGVEMGFGLPVDDRG